MEEGTATHLGGPKVEPMIHLILASSNSPPRETLDMLRCLKRRVRVGRQWLSRGWHEGPRVRLSIMGKNLYEEDEEKRGDDV